MPSVSHQSAFSEYLNTLCGLQGFISSHQCDVTLVVGDFNVDFTRDGLFNPLLLDFLAEQNLLACDLLFQDSVNFTYERDDGSTRSWILCSESFHSQVFNVCTINSGSILSDHLPLCFQLNV